MRIAAIGTGGSGGPLGASFLKAGLDVTLVTRGDHPAAMREKGLHAKGDRGENSVRPVQVTDNFADIAPVDFVLVCAKSWDVELVGERIRAIVGPQSAVIPLQNGIDAAQKLIPILGREAVMRGVAFVTGTTIEPGVIQQTGTHQRIIFGELDGRISERGQQLRDLCEAVGFEGVLSPNIMVPMWEKFIGLVPFRVTADGLGLTLLGRDHRLAAPILKRRWYELRIIAEDGRVWIRQTALNRSWGVTDSAEAEFAGSLGTFDKIVFGAAPAAAPGAGDNPFCNFFNGCIEDPAILVGACRGPAPLEPDHYAILRARQNNNSRR